MPPNRRTPSPAPTTAAPQGAAAPTSGGFDPAAIMAMQLQQQSANDPPVFWGSAGPVRRLPDGSPDVAGYYMPVAAGALRDSSGAQVQQGSSLLPSSQAVANFWAWTEEERAAFGKRLYSAGIIDDPSNFQAMYQAWAKAVDGSATAQVAGINLTPWQVVDLWDGMSTGHRKDQTKTQTSYNIPSPQEAEAAIKAIFRDKVGRDPDEGELSKYRGMILRQAKENPSVTTVSYDATGNATSTTSGGLDLQSAIGDAVQEDDNYGAYQAAVPLFNALMGAIGAPV